MGDSGEDSEEEIRRQNLQSSVHQDWDYSHILR